MNFSDIFRSSFMDLAQTSSLSIWGAIGSMVSALVIGLFMYFLYRYCYGGVVYNRNFNLSLILMCLLTCMVVMTISSNIILSLGMVGALSIVRFRTAIKDPVDLVFLFWSIVAGIACGARIYEVAAGGTVFVALVFIIMNLAKWKQNAYVLVVNYDDIAIEAVESAVKALKGRMRAKIVSKGGINEATFEIKVKKENTEFVKEISEIEGVHNVTLVAYDGDYAS